MIISAVIFLHVSKVAGALIACQLTIYRCWLLNFKSITTVHGLALLINQRPVTCYFNAKKLEAFTDKRVG
jgi:hypothetical protein